MSSRKISCTCSVEVDGDAIICGKPVDLMYSRSNSVNWWGLPDAWTSWSAATQRSLRMQIEGHLTMVEQDGDVYRVWTTDIGFAIESWHTMLHEPS